jgi:hypothetical protein
LESNKPPNLDNKRKMPSQSKRQRAVFAPPFMSKASSLGAFNTAFDVPKRLLNRGVDISRLVIGTGQLENSQTNSRDFISAYLDYGRNRP